MIELVANLWAVDADARVITTNATLRNDGAAVMGRGCALEAKQRFPGIEFEFGQRIRQFGNHVQVIRWDGIPLVSFPVKYHWRNLADLALIERSASELNNLAAYHQWTRVVMPRPGCGNGGRDWVREVRPILAPMLDNRFIVVSL